MATAGTGLNFGIQECSKCDYYLRCNECAYHKIDIERKVNYIKYLQRKLDKANITYRTEFDLKEVEDEKEG